ncbi:MAG: hypothetical protein LBC80_02115 [Treponema sp.]|jgi:hypothetical protein|nr:hypothetical protein [Treponema sp.]
MGSRNHLAFLSTLIHGRTDEHIQEGMLGAFDVVWRNSVGSSLNAFSAYLQRANNTALTAFNARNFANTPASLGQSENFYNLTRQFFDKHHEFFTDEQSLAITLFGNNILNLDTHQYLELFSLNEANNALIQISNAVLRQNRDTSSFAQWQQGNIAANAALSSEQQTRNTINSLQREIENITARAGLIDTEINRHHDIVHLTNTLTAIDSLSSGFMEEERISVYRYYTIAHNDLQNTINTGRANLERGSSFLEGDRQIAEDGDVTILSFPTEALEILSPIVSTLTIELQNNNRILTQFRNEPQTIRANEEMTNLFGNYEATVNEMTMLLNQTTALTNNARSRSSQAEAYRQEGDRLFREAQGASLRQDFGLARDLLQRSSARIAASLEIQASSELRSHWDTQLINLGQAISSAENDMIITEVRDMVNRARQLYFAGNFQQAEENLERARNRWRVTNPEENEEVIYWLAIIRTALSARSGRVISPTAPLFSEMSQLLSQAQRNFEEGVRLLNIGQRTNGLVRFNEALLITREVRLMFPLNQEAGILELRIEQHTDPAAFNAAFEQRLRTAITGTRARSIEAFADLQNLAEINPRYPNIRGIITQAEIDMGFRPPPPNPANIARSRELTASAGRILNENLTTLFDAALTQIDEAILLDMGNTQATLIKDRLLTRMNIPDAIVLSSEDEIIFQRAMRELQAGNTIVARALVGSLMENPRNRNITKLVELQRRLATL